MPKPTTIVAPENVGQSAPKPGIVTVVVQVRLQALAVPEPDGGYSVIVPALPGCFTEGGTIEEVQANVIEAAEGWLDSQHDHRKADALKMVAE
jgi:predicted RNase H-like HicB family nuclease